LKFEIGKCLPDDFQENELHLFVDSCQIEAKTEKNKQRNE
jgi:hypothetical protein